MQNTRVAVAATLLSLTTACGAMMHGSRQDLEVQSSPAGATFETNPPTGTYTTPSRISLERKNSYVLTFTSPGYTPATFNVHNSIGTGTVIADVLLTGLIGVLVDGLTGSWYGLNPESATVSLVRVGMGPGPEEIHVRLGRADGSAAIDVRADAPGVAVQVTKR